jgi:hypothetical protein
MRAYLIGFLLIVVAVVVFQGRSVRYGLMLDDYSQRAELREGDWSLRSLVEASHLGGPRRRVAMWWQETADLYFFRPVAFFLMRLEYVIGGWHPEVMHGFSLAWHVAAACLVIVLARLTTGSGTWAGLAGVLFALHPANYLTVRWIACQNEQMTTVFLLAALLAYGLASDWFPHAEAASTRRAIVLRVLAAALFVLALGCRESAIVFVGMVVLGDAIARPQGWRGRWVNYAALVAIAVGYLALRSAFLGGFEMPARPYAWPPSEPGFARFVIDKFVYYMLALFLYVPVVGFSGIRFLRENPVLFYGSFAALVAAGLTCLIWLRSRRVIQVWVVVAVLPLLPVLPVFASAHHLYLASAAMVIAMIAVWEGLVVWAANRASRPARLLPVAIAVLIALHIGGFAGANIAYDAGVAGLSAASHGPVRDVVTFGGEFQPNDRLFFVNLPMLGFNCIPAIEEATGVAPLKGYVLTFAPAFLGMDRPAYCERVDEHTLRVWLEDEGYFSDLAGQRMLEAVGRDRPFAVGETFRTHDFTVEVVRGSENGIQEFRFTFERPLDDPRYHFFFGSQHLAAFPLRFDEEPTSAAAQRPRTIRTEPPP